MDQTLCCGFPAEDELTLNALPMITGTSKAPFVAGLDPPASRPGPVSLRLRMSGAATRNAVWPPLRLPARSTSELLQSAGAYVGF
jgi:hypothetical protein